VKSFRTGRQSARGRGRSGTSSTRRGLWLLTVLATAALFAFLPGAATAANPSADLDQCANGPAPSPSTDGCDSAAADWVNGFGLGGYAANATGRSGVTPVDVTLQELAVESFFPADEQTAAALTALAVQAPR